MKKLLLVFILPLASLTLYAQEASKQREVGLTFRSLDSFGMTFRTGTTRALWRFNTVFLSGNKETFSADSVDSEASSSGFNLSIGREFRKPVNENLTLRFGADVTFRYSKYRNQTNDKSIVNDDYISERTTYGPGIELVFGLNYALGKNFIIGAELLPSFQYHTGKSTTSSLYYEKTESDISGFSYGLTNAVMLSLVYVF